ncbi:unnamed protein product [Ectocarpus sp. CCAP 1310/34]|nr:unnamed protein product [Ectocarpus sp. CCAP 1310/34]
MVGLFEAFKGKEQERVGASCATKHQATVARNTST